MGRKYDYDYIIIGSGPAGSAAALTLAKSRKRVAIVEDQHLGGSNLNTRDVPYGVALNFAHTYHKALHSPEFGRQDFSFNFPTTLAHQLKAIVESGGNSQKTFNDAGIMCIRGYAHFLDANTLAVGEKKYTSRNFIIATGAQLNTSSISGTDKVSFITPETAIKIRRLPKVALIIGGGATGCEIAEYYAKIGTKVILMESSSRILPHEDTDASQSLANYFADELGIMILTSCKAIALGQDNASKFVVFQNNRVEKMVRIDCIVLATGSQPKLDLGLENAKVKYTPTGIKVNKLFQTTAKNIYAVGDCIGNDSSTERASYEGKLLASNLVNKTKNIANYTGFARAVGTSPAVITIGPNENELKRHKRKCKKAIVNLQEIPASKIHNIRYGFVKLLADGNSHIIGGTIVAPNAEAMSSEIALAVRHRLSALELASTPHIANDFSYAIKLAAQKLISKNKK